MKPQQTLGFVMNVHRRPRYRQAGLLALVLCFLVCTTASCLWLFVFSYQHERDFHQQVAKEAKQHSEQISHYLLQLQASLDALAASLPKAELAKTRARVVFSGAEQTRTPPPLWLTQQIEQPNRLPDYVQSLAVLPVTDFHQQRLARLSGNFLSQSEYFLLQDMFNRLGDGQPLWVEVARLQRQSRWVLHQLVPIKDKGKVIAFMYVSLSFQGVLDRLQGSDIVQGKLSLLQTIGHTAALPFFSIGQGSDQFLPRHYGITGSHWELAYQPSQAWFDQYKQQHLSVLLLQVAALLGVIALAVGVWCFLPLLGKQTPPGRPRPPQQAAVRPKPRAVPNHIFRAYDIRGVVDQALSPELAYEIGCAFAGMVIESGDTSVILARDARLHSESLAEALSQGLKDMGCHIIDIGVAPTPLMNFSACQHAQTNSGIMVTASHNPKEYNGFKMVIQGKTLVDDEIQRLKLRIIENKKTLAERKGQHVLESMEQTYIDYIVGDMAVADNLKVVIDCASGATCQLAPRLFLALGCQVVPLFCEFDGQFPHHDPDPSVPENLAALKAAVLAEEADIGLAFDGDGDRLVVITKTGKILWPDQLMMIFAQDITSRHLGCDIVFDVKSTRLLKEVIMAHGARPVMAKTGHSHIKAKMRETGALLGGEFSGHLFFKERWFGFDDGLYAAARLLELMSVQEKSIDELSTALPVSVSTPEIKIVVPDAEKFSLIQQLTELADFDDAVVTTIDGLRVDFTNGWALVRASNTSDALTLRFEADDDNALLDIVKAFNDLLQQVALAPVAISSSQPS